MNRLYCLIIMFITCGVSSGQNLVPNGDFEQYNNCPTWLTQIDTALYWINPAVWPPGGSPEYFNQCATGTSVDVPSNDLGYQMPRSGSGYAGLALWRQSFTFREYIETPFLSPLVANTTYHFEMYISLGDKTSYTTDAIGIYFSNTPITGIMNYDPLPYTPQLNNLNGNTPDTLNWTLVSGDYTASGGENYLIIGNFKNDLNTTTLLVNTNGIYDATYIYVDDVSLTIATNIDEHKGIVDYNLFPNPFDDKLVIENNSNELSEIILYDIASRNLLLEKFTNSVTLNTEQLAKGIYLYEVRNKNGVVKKGKLVKE